MTVLSAQSIRSRGIFEPFSERSRCERTGTTYGLGPAGYDVRVAEDLTLWPSSSALGRAGGAFKLASTIEHFDMPWDLIGRVHDKSSLARRGLTVQNTIVEPGWRGYLTLELINHGQEVIELRPGDPIAQIILELLDEPTEQPYVGRYQDQAAGPQPARALTGEEAAI